MFTVAIYTIIKTWKQSKSPLMEGYIKKMSHTHTEEYYSAIKRMKSCHL